jgi:hypothetical protein
MWDGPFYRVRRDGYEIRFVPNAGVPLEEIDDVDMWVIFDSGERWSGTIYTLDNVRKVMTRWQETGECLDGRYFWVWDGLIVRDPGIDEMVAVVDDLVQSGEYTGVFRDVGPEDPDGCPPNGRRGPLRHRDRCSRRNDGPSLRGRRRIPQDVLDAARRRHSIRIPYDG